MACATAQEVLCTWVATYRGKGFWSCFCKVSQCQLVKASKILQPLMRLGAAFLTPQGGFALIGDRHGVDMCHGDFDATRKAYAALHVVGIDVE